MATMELFSIDINEIITNLIQLFTALVLSMTVAYERESESKSAGLRTFPLVSLAACAFTILATSFGDTNAQAKMVSGVITGIGFIGGGAILKSSGKVSGTSTAAAIWSTGAIGIAVGFGRIEIAIVISVVAYCTLKLFGAIKEEESDAD